MASARLPTAMPHPTGTPRVGDLYWVDTAACYGRDRKPRRPVVVVRAPNPPLLTDAVVVARTSDVNADGTGVKHTAVADTTLDRDGKFMKKRRHHIDQRLFSMPETSYAGELAPDVLHDVLAMLELE